MSCPGHWGSELEAVVCAKILQQPLLIWAIADGSQLHPLINYSPTARIFTQTIIHISYSGLHYNALIHDSDQTSLLLSQQVFNSINNPTHVAAPTCHSHPTGPSDTSHSEAQLFNALAMAGRRAGTKCRRSDVHVGCSMTRYHFAHLAHSYQMPPDGSDQPLFIHKGHVDRNSPYQSRVGNRGPKHEQSF
jgi:hypothetical protein